MAMDPAKALTRLSSIEFSVAEAKMPLHSAAKTVKNGSRVILDDEGSFIITRPPTGKRVGVKIKGETFVFEVQYENGKQGTITLDSGVGVHVWRKD